MKLVDTHCHIQSIDFKREDQTNKLWEKLDRTSDSLIKSANKVGVVKLICVGCDLKDSIHSIKFTKGRDNLYSSIGIHPHEAGNHLADNKWEEFSSLVKEPKVIAIGECGLDYFYNHSTKEAQRKILVRQIKLAISEDLPLIFHVREAFEDFWPIFDSLNNPKKPIAGVLHSFSDSLDNMNEALRRGLYIGINGIATFTKLKEQIIAYKNIPLSRVLLETDSPYLTPVPFRGTINQPKNVRIIAEFLAELRGEQADQVAKLTTLNAEKLFNI